jgi:protein TonB
MELWDREVQGETLLRVRIEKDGTVGEVTVTVSSGEAAFDSAAVRGARAARFEPARRGEDAIAVWATLPVVFSKRPG